MRIFSNCYELMSETGRNLWEMGQINIPKSYQNKDIQGNEDFHTKELICEQYCLTKLEDPKWLFVFDKRSIEWTEAEFKERVEPPVEVKSNMGSMEDYFMYHNPGMAWELRKDLWEDFLVNGKFDYTYNERMRRVCNAEIRVDNLTLVINELIRNPDTRQAIVPIYSLCDVQNIGGKKRVPCSMYYNLMLRTNASGEKQLNICYHQRSADYVTHFGNDVYLAWKLMEWVANILDVKPGYLYHTIDSLHSYKKDWQKLKTSISDIA